MPSHPNTTQVPVLGPSGHDVFICHATEDKATFAEPLAKALRKRGIDVWYDAFTIDWGDSLRQKIDSGVATCRFGLVVLSHAFFAKRWTQYELDGLAGREMASGEKVILPIWHGIDREAVARYSPSLAERAALRARPRCEPTRSARAVRHLTASFPP